MFLQKTDLNVVPGGIIPVMHVSQYDVGRELKFVLYSGYDYASLESGTTVTIEGTKPDGHGFQYSGVLDQNAHTATFVTTEQMTVLAGAIECKLTLYLNSQRIGTALFILDVEKAGINDSTIISDTELPLIIAQATGQMERAEAAADAAALSETNAANSEIICGSFMRMAGASAASAEQSAIISGSFMRTAGNFADEAEASAASANVDALKSEGFAVGKQNGTDVGSTSPYYHNNAEYFKNLAEAAAQGMGAADMTGATATTDGTHGLIKQPHAGDQDKYFKGDGNWSTVAASEVSYDNTTSGLTADDTQEAIDEVSALVNGTTEITTKAHAPVISVNDAIPVNAVDVKAKVEPIQDLHGYDKPWVGGAGRNLFNMGSKISATFAGMTVTSDNDSIAFNGTKYGTGEYRPSELLLTLPAGTYYVKAFPNKSMDYAPSVFINTSNCNNIERSFTISEESNISVAFGFYKDNITYTDYKLQIVISGTSGIDKFYPYTNICPIIGRSSVKVTRTGKNLFDLDGVQNLIRNGTTSTSQFTNENGVITNKRSIGNDGYYEYNFPMLIDPRTVKISADVKVSGTNSGKKIRVRLASIDQTIVTPETQLELSNKDVFEHIEVICSVTQKAYYNLCLQALSGGNYVEIKNVQIELGSTVTPYEPYTGNSYTIQLGDTYYGGELDVTSGVLTVTDGYIASYNGEILSGTWISDRDEYTAGGTPTTGAQVVYKLATPITIQLTPQEIQLLQDNNTLYADSGDASLRYYANSVKNIAAIVGDIRDDVDDLEDKVAVHDANFAPIESASTATQAYTTGQYIERPDGLYKVIADIANGGTFTVGTNITKTTIAAELLALKALITS